MPRVARLVAPGYPHHVTQRGNNRQKIFFTDQDRRKYLSLMTKYLQECRCELTAYCLMPNHVHLLLTPVFRNDLAKFMQKLSLTFTQYLNNRRNRTGRLWECRFYSSIVDKDVYFKRVIRYIERNPVRAKLVDKPEAYPWSSVQDRLSRVPGKRRHALLEFLYENENEEQLKEIRAAVRKGLPAGGEAFQEKMKEIFGPQLHRSPRGRPRK